MGRFLIAKETETTNAFLKSKREGANVDVTVLTMENMSELGRFAVTENATEVGAFKTPTLRNIAVTGPYMHDGSLETQEDVVTFYKNGARLKDTDPLAADDPQMTALQAYINHERRGVTLEPGKH